MSDIDHLSRRLPPPDRLALFLDVDGTLIAATHDAREHGITPERIALLEALSARLGGALAILTGRTIESVDRFLHPLVLPCGGLQGADRRFATGKRVMPVLTAEARRLFEGIVEDVSAFFPMVEIEWKPGGLSFVYEEGSAFIGQLHALLTDRVDGEFKVMRGRVAIDVVPLDADKGHALDDFMRTETFAGRTPVHVGDDTPDEPAFRAAAAAGGFGISVHRKAPGVPFTIGSETDTWTLLRTYADLHK
ncbi:trehalose-phosphatase [Chthonobacter rhizosphaerae]|uniref:trehalose-phosphatase n=1 Tax=Chthonobacter rhizosphaerae TaxID=2735553 RepID=UPI0015EE4552|nr:HAD-IIB family hydrolase [Chthonobacter rhizosphaerae]